MILHFDTLAACPSSEVEISHRSRKFFLPQPQGRKGMSQKN